MDTRTYEIKTEMSEEALQDLRMEAQTQMSNGRRPRMVALSAEESTKLQPYDTPLRKGYLRNKPCPCGSGKKFKKCHW